MFLSIIFVKTPPKVSTPRDNGVTSSSNRSVTSPVITAACIAAPTATHSIGSKPRSGDLFKICSTNLCTSGILVIPPIRIILSIPVGVSFASSSAFNMVRSVFWTIGCARDSSLVRVKVRCKCLGPALSDVIKGKSMSVLIKVVSSIFAFSAASLSLVIPILSFLTSTPVCLLNSSKTYSITALSTSVPPNCVSPLVDKTWKTPLPKSITVTSWVPPPKLNTRIFISFSSLSTP